MIVTDEILLAFCEALSAPNAPMEHVVRGSDDFDPWENAVNPADAPLWVLPWLAKLIGTQWIGDPAEDLRSLLIERPNYKRGVNSTIAAAAKTTLTGTKSVFLSPRLNNNPWLLSVTTLPAETPDPTTTQEAIRAALPAWVRLITGQEDTPIIDQANATLTIDNVGATVTINEVTAVDVA